MTLTAKGRFDLPSGSVVVKNFLLPLDERNPQGSALRIETRVLARINGQWEGYSYAWDREGLDGRLIGAAGYDRAFTLRDAAGRPYTYRWHYPSRTECFQCHTVVSDRLLGLTPEALNHAYLYPQSGRRANQLATYESIGLIKDGLPKPVAEMPAMASFRDTSETLRNRSRAYLAANCSMCHQPGGPTSARMDFRWTTTDFAMGAINATGYFTVPGLPGTRIIKPGDPDKSTLLYRIGHRGAGIQMPPLGTQKVDPEAVAVIRAWVQELGATK